MLSSRRARKQSVAFGIATTALPLLFGTAVGLLFGYAAIPAVVIGSLLATRAATLVAHQTLDATGQRLLDDRMLNVVLVLVFTTATLGPILTERVASRMSARTTGRTLGLAGPRSGGRT